MLASLCNCMNEKQNANFNTADHAVCVWISDTIGGQLQQQFTTKQRVSNLRRRKIFSLFPMRSSSAFSQA